MSDAATTGIVITAPPLPPQGIQRPLEDPLLAYYARNDWMAAFRAYRGAWRIAVSLGDRHDEADSIDALGKIAHGAGATKLADRLLDIARVRRSSLAAAGGSWDTPETLE
ncbi:MAG: hypothetical protein M3Q29_23490 [Chloroflexota bacterium]|nr:hypothetical protein [Chloroflexota bacterium]